MFVHQRSNVGSLMVGILWPVAVWKKAHPGKDGVSAFRPPRHVRSEHRPGGGPPGEVILFFEVADRLAW